MSEGDRTALIGLAGVAVGALLTASISWLSTSQQLQLERDTRSFEIRLSLYSEFDNLSLLLMNDFLEQQSANQERTLRFNEVLSKIALLGSKPVRVAAANVHLVVAKMKVAAPSELKSLQDSYLLSDSRIKFNDAARQELGLANEESVK